jgi:hypothetical protein
LIRPRLLLFALGGLACITSAADRGMPLYPGPGPLPRDQVAVLGGYVAGVDGRDLSHFSAGLFELLPGCHVVQTPTRWGEVDYAGGMVATTGTVTFALPMTAGHRYVIVVDPGPLGPSAFTVSVRADELTADGALLRSRGPTRSVDELEACRHGA